MQIKFSPMRRDDPLAASVSGDAITVNGVTIDLSSVGEGEVLSQDAIGSEWVVEASRVGGEIHLTLILPHGADAPQETLFPAHVAVADGPVPVQPPSAPADGQQ